MKKLLVIVALLVSAVSFSKAQGFGQQGTPEEQAQRSLDRPVVASLNLSADQKAKAMPILVAYNKAVADLRTKAMAGGDMQAAMAEMRPKMTALAEENEKLLIAMLTPEQKKTYDAALATAKETNPAAATVIIGGGRGGQRPPGQ